MQQVVSVAKLVADAPHGSDERGLGGIELDFCTELVDEVVDGARRTLVVVAPDLVEDLVAAQDPAAVLDQVAKQPELPVGDLDVLAVDTELLAGEIHLDAAVGVHILAAALLCASSNTITILIFPCTSPSSLMTRL